jgi:hypothetical protein
MGRYALAESDFASANFLWEVSQSSLSTPGVLLPSFPVTRRTASNLAFAERVSRCCRAFALFHLPACTAFTIRVWSRRTSSSMVRQSMASHCSVRSKAAPACAVICLPCYVALPESLVMNDQKEFSPLSRRVILQPVSTPLQLGLRFLLHPLSAPPSPCFAAGLPLGSDTDLTCFVCVTEWFRPLQLYRRSVRP